MKWNFLGRFRENLDFTRVMKVEIKNFLGIFRKALDRFFKEINLKHIHHENYIFLKFFMKNPDSNRINL